MQRKWQKATTAAVASALIASQTLMQVMAAGGTIDADMSTKVPVIRVVVPTQMAVAVNEFEMGDTSQITSGEFTMKNVSEIPVNVKVTSTATLGTGVTLVPTKAEAQESTDTDNPAMWLAAVAAVNDNSGTLEYLAEGDNKTVGAVTGTEANATAFETGADATTAVQNFYLAAAEGAKYKGIIGDETGEVGNGADYYQLTLVTPDSDDAAGVAKLAETQDVYIAAGAVAANTPQALTRIEKGAEASAVTGWTTGTSKVYTVGAAPVAYNIVKDDGTNAYLYIDTATTADGNAAFRYAGALSSAKSGWSNTDLSAVNIQYDITGITTSAYADMEGLTYGYKADEAAEEESRISITADGLMTIEGLSGENYQSGTITLDGNDYVITAGGSWVSAQAPATFQFNSTWTNNIKGKSLTIKITLKDSSTIEETVEVPES